MATERQFEELKAWQEGREIVKMIYAVTRAGEFAKDFGLKDQIQRAAVSINSNIAEGFERDSTSEFVKFLGYAKGSAGEVRSQLIDNVPKLGMTSAISRFRRASRRSFVRMDCQWTNRRFHSSPRGRGGNEAWIPSPTLGQYQPFNLSTFQPFNLSTFQPFNLSTFQLSL